MAWCQDNWYYDVVYADEDYSVSQPLKIAFCEIVKMYTESQTTPAPTIDIEKIIKLNQTSGDQYKDELLRMVPITMILGLIFLIMVLYRSCNKLKLDWYRLIAIYIFVTIGVPLSIQLGPQQGGFNRVIGFGILVHNLGELFILNHVYFGNPGHGKNHHNRFSAIGAILYIWIIMALICFIKPLWLLFVILMLQGSFCDWTLVGTFIYLGKTFKPKGIPDTCCQINFGTFGIFAALTHILSIQPLFLMMALPNFKVGGAITVILLMPTFILYIFFSSSNPEQVPKIIESNGYAYLEVEGDKRRNSLLRAIKHNTGKQMEFELKQRKIENVESGDDTNIVYDDNKESEKPVSAVDAKEKKPKDGDDGSSIFDKIIRNGLNYMNDGAHKKAMKIIFGFAAFMCTLNSLMVLFAPCYVPPPDCI